MGTVGSALLTPGSVRPAKAVRAPKSIKLGFVPLTDCAPLVVAHELGLFAKYGLRVTLHRELGWASIRDKIIFGELDAAHALAAMPLAATLGLGSIRAECVSGLVLNLHGNAITLSNELWGQGVRDGASLREEIKRWRGQKVLTLGVVYSFSSHRHLLRKWLAAHGIDPERDVRMVVVPPPQMATNLKAGNLDGFCVGEPWNSAAVKSRVGWCVAVSAELAPGHPEKVLMVRRDFAEQRAEEHRLLIAALLEACAYCDSAENREHVVATLARPEFVAAPAALLWRGLSGELDFGHDQLRKVPDFCLFHRNNANEPSEDKVAWALDLVRASGLCRDPAELNRTLGRGVFRQDIFAQASRLQGAVSTRPEVNR